MPRSKILSVAALLAAICSISAQDNVRVVPPGREIRDTKLLTLGKTDRWELEIVAGEMLNCVVDSSAFDPVLELVDGDGNVLGTNDGKGTRSQLWLRMKKGGKVAFRVRGFEGSGGGQYNFWLQRYRTQELEPDGTTTHRFGREQWWHYLIPLKAGDVLVPTATGHGRVTAVYDMDRKGVVSLHGGYRAPHDGSYFVRIELAIPRAAPSRCWRPHAASPPPSRRVSVRAAASSSAVGVGKTSSCWGRPSGASSSPQSCARTWWCTSTVRATLREHGGHRPIIRSHHSL